MVDSRRSRGGAASGAHAFVRPADPRLGLALGAGHLDGPGGSSMLPAALTAGATLRPERCALDGCGRERADPIHWPVD